MGIGTLLFIIWVALLTYIILKMVNVLSGGEDEEDSEDAKFNSDKE